jgi:hypothetical protein
MPERFESNVFDPAATALMKTALEAAFLKCKPSRADEKQVQTLLASAIIDPSNQASGGSTESSTTPSRSMRSLRTSRSQRRELIRPILGLAGPRSPPIARLSRGTLRLLRLH